MTAYIGYDNAFYQSGVTITSNLTLSDGYPVENCYDYKLHTSAKTAVSGIWTIGIDAGSGNTISANYLGIAGHNLDVLGVGASLRYSDDDVTYTQHVSPLSDAGVNFGYASTVETHRYWQVRVGASAAGKYISQIMFGQALQCRPIGQGFRPPVYEHYQALNSTNRQGNYIGNIVKREPTDLRIRQRGIDPADFRTDWVPFLQHAATKPFFFVWDYENYDDEAVFCWTDKPQTPAYESLCTISLDMTVKAVLE